MGAGMGMPGMGLDYGEAGTGSYSYATYGTGIGSPTPEELEGYGGRNGLEGGEQGCNSIDIFLGPGSGPEPGPSHVCSFETCQNL